MRRLSKRVRLRATTRLTPVFWSVSALLALPVLAQDASETAPEAAAEPSIPTSPDPTSQLGNSGRGQAMEAPVGVAGAREGLGIALSADGRSRLHLKLDAGVGFNTNPYSVPFESEGFAGDAITRIRPGVEFEYPGSALAIDAGINVDYGFMPGLINEATQQYMLFNSSARGGVELNRGGAFSFGVSDSLSWANTPGVVGLGTIFNRLTNNLNAGVGFRPGGGALTLKAAYTFGFIKWMDLFGNTSQLVRDGALDTMTHTATLRADWRFLPRTGVYLQANGGLNMFPFDDANVNPMSLPVSIKLGFMGQLTSKLSGIAAIGYQNPLILSPDGGVTTSNLVGAAGQAEVRWSVTPNSRLGAGFQRRIMPVPLYQYATDNRLYAVFKQTLGRKLDFSVNSGFSILEFGPESEIAGQPITTVGKDGTRVDGQLDLRANLSYFLLEWLSLGVANNLEWRMTGANAYSPTGDGFNLSYLSNETLLLASVFY